MSPSDTRADILQGTLDLMVLQTASPPWARCMATASRAASSRSVRAHSHSNQETESIRLCCGCSSGAGSRPSGAPPRRPAGEVLRHHPHRAPPAQGEGRNLGTRRGDDAAAAGTDVAECVSSFPASVACSPVRRVTAAAGRAAGSPGSGCRRARTPGTLSGRGEGGRAPRLRRGCADGGGVPRPARPAVRRHAPAGPPLRLPAVQPDARLPGDGRPHARTRHRRQHRHLWPGRSRPAPVPAIPGCRASGCRLRDLTQLQLHERRLSRFPRLAAQRGPAVRWPRRVSLSRAHAGR